jgi:CBS domain-containing protein
MSLGTNTTAADGRASVRFPTGLPGGPGGEWQVAAEIVAPPEYESCSAEAVVEGGKLVGLVSIGDLVKQLSSDQKREIQYLTDYITGKYPA